MNLWYVGCYELDLGFCGAFHFFVQCVELCLLVGTLVPVYNSPFGLADGNMQLYCKKISFLADLQQCYLYTSCSLKKSHTGYFILFALDIVRH